MASGLILFTYIGAHLINHALGLTVIIHETHLMIDRETRLMAFANIYHAVTFRQ